jgi:hypothetical protein
MSEKPLWLKAVLRVERVVGGPVETVVRSEAYFETVAKVTKARRKAINLVEGVSKRGLHMANLPAGTDVRRMREQLSRLERRLDQLSYDVADLDEDERPLPQPRSKPRSDSRSRVE